MSKRTCILAAFFGLLVGGAVWLWPARPMWVSEPGAGRIVGFSFDRRILVTCSDSAHGDQAVSRWQVDTGRLLSRATNLILMLFTNSTGMPRRLAYSC